MKAGSADHRNVRFAFKERNVVYKLSATYSISGTVQLDASGLPGGLRLKAASNRPHFTILSPSGNLTATNIKFEDAYISR